MGIGFALVPMKAEVLVNFEELMGICKPSNPKILQDAEIDEMILEVHWKVQQITGEESSSFGGWGFQEWSKFGINTTTFLFSTLCLVDDEEIEKFEPLEDVGDVEQSVFILKFVMLRKQNDITHLKAKKCKMMFKCWPLYLSTIVPWKSPEMRVEVGTKIQVFKMER